MSVPREELHRLVDSLPEDATETASRFLSWLVDEGPGMTAVPLSEQEWAAVNNGEKQLTSGDYIPLEDLEAELRRGL